MKYKILLIIILTIVLFSIGCVRRPPGLEPEVIEYHKGTKGLEMSFIKNAPPAEVWEGNEFAIGLELENKGAYPIEEGYIVISGFIPDYIEVTPLEQTIDLQGKSPGYPEGDYKIINFQAKSFNIPQGSYLYFFVNF